MFPMRGRPHIQISSKSPPNKTIPGGEGMGLNSSPTGHIYGSQKILLLEKLGAALTPNFIIVINYFCFSCKKKTKQDNCSDNVRRHITVK